MKVVKCKSCIFGKTLLHDMTLWIENFRLSRNTFNELRDAIEQWRWIGMSPRFTFSPDVTWSRDPVRHTCWLVKAKKKLQETFATLLNVIDLTEKEPHQSIKTFLVLFQRFVNVLVFYITSFWVFL